MARLDAALATQMPSLPITSRVMSKATGKDPAQISAGEMFPAMQERRGEELRLRQGIADTEAQLAGKEQEQKVAGLEQKMQLQETQATELRDLPERTNLNTARQELASAAFVPTKESAQDIATIFSLTGIIGMAIGGGAKDNAYAAMAGMNGMLEGYKKGRADIYKRERESFDKNLKSLQTKVQTLQQELTDAIQLKQQDFRAGETAIEIALAKSGSDLLDLKRKKNGDMAALETVVQTGKDVDSLVKMSNDQFKQAEDRKFKERELAQQERLRMAQMAQTKALAELKGTTGGLKMPAKLQEAYIADNQLRVDIGSLKNQLQDGELVQQIKQYGVESFLSEEGGKAISQVMQRQMPSKLSKFLTEVRDMRNNYYLTISGKAVTGGEALRNYGVVPQPGDSQQQMLNKLDGMERRVGQKINAIRGMYNAPDISGTMSPGTPTMVNPNESYAVSASEQPAAGGKTIVRQGTVNSGPNAGKRVIEYSDGTKEYK
jgi:hypothetical protein